MAFSPSRADEAIRRYEEEIRNICKSNEVLRESIQSRSSAGLELSDRGKLEAKVESLEAYVQSLERRLQTLPDPLPDPQLSELSSLRKAVTSLSQENESLRCKLESVSLSLGLAEQRITDHSACQRRVSELEGTVARLREAISTANERKSDTFQEQSYSMHSQPDIIPYRDRETAIPTAKSTQSPAKDYDIDREFLSSQLIAFMRESEEKQEELKRRIALLETRKRQRKKSSTRKTPERDLSEPRNKSKECERCRRNHSKELSSRS